MAVGAPQQVLSGKYRLERELGRGGMGSVWLAEHLTLRSPVAIKLIESSIAEDPDALARFLREAQAAASLRSPHVVQILDHGVDHGVPFIVMELLEGESLAARLERARRLSPADTARIMTQVARAITRAHEAGIIHRDLKPDNIYLVRNDEEEVAKVLDFGVAKASTHGMGAVSSATRTGSVLGTPYYMSPEQAEGSKDIDHRSDLWSLGVIAWECLLGVRPFEAETLGGLLLAICAREIPVPSQVGHVPPGFDAWFARACSRQVSYRFGSAKELAQELRSVCSGADVSGGYAPPPTSGYAPQHGFAPVSSSHGPPVQGRSVPLASGSSMPSASSDARPLTTTTGQLGVSASQHAAKKKSAGVWIALGVSAVLSGAVGAFFVFGGKHEDTPASATPAVSLAPAAAPPAPSPAAPPVEPEALAPGVAPSSAAAPAVPTAAPPAAVARPRSAPSRPGKAEKPVAAPPAAAPAPAPAPAPPPPQPAPTPAAKPRVNLGI